MDLNNLLDEFKKGNIDKKEILDKLNKSSFSDIGVANIDHDREKRRGFQEVIYSKDKSPSQLRKILTHLLSKNKKVLATKAQKEHFIECKNLGLEIDEENGLIHSPMNEGKGEVSIISAGTSDYKIAQEAKKTAQFLGSNVKFYNDYGIAGLNRIFSIVEEIEKSNAVIVVAGMDGALPTAVAGLIKKPVIAVPTSTGYGTSFNGLSALFSMLNSCSPGVTVVNIDNGFGAGYYANLINLQTEGKI
ncbi:MAG: nickel pincer cofactor biosynthesis protein LarB [Nanobdellota archaeon]